RCSFLFDPVRIVHAAPWLILTLVFAGNRERLAGVQGAAMSPLVAGTTPAKSGMEALGPSPPLRLSSAVPFSRQRAGERVLSTDEGDTIFTASAHSMPSYRSVVHHHAILRTITMRPDPFRVHLPLSGSPSRAPAAGGFAVRPTPRAGTTFYPCRSF